MFVYKEFVGFNSYAASLSISCLVQLCQEVPHESFKKSSAVAGQENILPPEVNMAVLLVWRGVVSAAGSGYHAEILLPMALPVLRLDGSAQEIPAVGGYGNSHHPLPYPIWDGEMIPLKKEKIDKMFVGLS